MTIVVNPGPRFAGYLPRAGDLVVCPKCNLSLFEFEEDWNFTEGELITEQSLPKLRQLLSGLFVPQQGSFPPNCPNCSEVWWYGPLNLFVRHHGWVFTSG